MNKQAVKKVSLSAAAGVTVLFVAACSSSTTTDVPDAAAGRVVETTLGSVTVPDRITSVVVIDGRRDLDIALAFDLPIVGIPVETEAPAEMPGALTAATATLLADGVPELYPRNIVDIEAIAAADPDIIIGRDEVVEEIYDDLSAVAPVLPVGSTGSGVPWQDDVTAIGAALGRDGDAAAIITEYDDRIAQFRTDHAQLITDTTVVPISTSDGDISLGRERITSIVLEDLGATFGSAWEQATPEAEFSRESVTVLSDADAILAAIGTEEELTAMNANPLWTNLPAVTDGRIVRTDKFTNDGGPLTALWTIDLAEQLYGV